jgi:benzoyl-CoA reductase/2-hydroxyglutaryl-CoA dehydratase subunit BcrC/BadD/HgdB
MTVREALDNLRELEAEWLDELQRCTQSGGAIVGYFCLYTPPELLSAVGAIPIRLALCGTHEAESAGERHMRPDTCAFCKAAIGGRDEIDPWARVVTHIAQPSTCDEMRRASGVWESDHGIPHLAFAFPRTWEGDAPLQLLTSELRWVAGELSRITGRPLTDDNLAQEIRVWNEVRSALARVHEARRQGGIVGRDMLELVSYTFTLPPDRVLPVLRELADGAKEDPEPTPRPRIMLMGSALARGDYRVLDMIEDAGARVATDTVCTGTRWFADRIAEQGDPFDALCRMYLRRAFCAFRRPNTPFIDDAKAEVGRSRIDGIVYKTLQFCDSWGHEVERVRKQLDLPLLHIQSNYSPSDIAQLRTRIQAFVEMLANTRG